MSYHTTEFQVRDYECDLQGIVNNAVYQNYLEHARHEFLTHKGIDFAALAQQQINLVVIRVELDYKTPLISKDRFTVTTHVEQVSKLKFCFKQQIHRQSDHKLVLDGSVFGTAMNANGRPMRFDGFQQLL